MMNQDISYSAEATIRRKRKNKPAGRDSGAIYAPAEFRPPPIAAFHGGYAGAKRTFDVTVASLLFVLTLPIMALAAALVRLSSKGPAVYVQERLGVSGIPFRIYKIRTMIHNCESLTGPRWAVPGDPRITPVGALLRATHVDELPQLWNVIRGDMSLIGPRPERPELIEKIVWRVPRYYERLTVKPGITGLAQVQLPPDTEMRNVADKLVLDLAYIDRIGLWTDTRILLCTLLKLITIPPHRYRFVLRSVLPANAVAESLLLARSTQRRAG